MSWGVSHINHAIHGKLNYQSIKKEVEASRKEVVYVSSGRSKNYYLHLRQKEHPVTGKYEEAGCYRMYNTDILQFFADGAVRIVTWPSAITYDEISYFGPVRCFNNNQHKYDEKRRFGSWDHNFPIPDGELCIDGNGLTVEELVDTYTIIDPARKKERREIAKKFRANALPRMMLGEFGDVWGKIGYKTIGWSREDYNGWISLVPVSGNLEPFARMLLNGEDHPNMHRIGEVMTEGPIAKSKEDCVRVACDYILKQWLLSGSEWETEKRIEYGRVNCHDL